MVLPSRSESLDPYFRVEILHSYHNPQIAVWHALKQDYGNAAVKELVTPDERACGEIAVNRLLRGNRGHYGPLEHPQITFNCIGFPHSVMQQARTHRVAVSFDVQSTRYTGEQVSSYTKYHRDCGYESKEPMKALLNQVFYFKPVGEYKDRQGNAYTYSETMRNRDMGITHMLALHYAYSVEELGFSPEHARLILPYCIRQHFVVSFNLRSLLHFCDLRLKQDAELEIRQLASMLFDRCKEWAPEISQWYADNRMDKAKLSP